MKANATLAEGFAAQGVKAAPENLCVLVHIEINALQYGVLDEVRAASPTLTPLSPAARAVRDLKFADCVPLVLAEHLLGVRLSDAPAVHYTCAQPPRFTA